MASSRTFVTSVVQLYMELSNTVASPNTALGEWARKLMRSSSRGPRASRMAFKFENSLAESEPAGTSDVFYGNKSVSIGSFLLGLLEHVGIGKYAFVELQVYVTTRCYYR